MLAFLKDNAGPISAICAMLVVGGSAIGAVLKLWGSIRDKFDAQDKLRRGEFATLSENMRAVFDEHEEKDQGRHEDNLRKFSDIRYALGIMGWRNGTGHVERRAAAVEQSEIPPKEDYRD